MRVLEKEKNKSSERGLPVNSSLLAGLGTTREPGRARLCPAPRRPPRDTAGKRPRQRMLGGFLPTLWLSRLPARNCLNLVFRK